MFKIEKDVPLPQGAGRGWRKYPFCDMEVGDSFLVPRDEVKLRSVGSNGRLGAATIYTAASQYGRRLGRRFTARKLPDGSVRVWRVE